MSPRPVSALLGLLCAVVLTGACSSEAGSPSAPDASTQTGTGVLAFTAPLLGGGTIEGTDFAGRDVAFWFWAPW